jgi:hypothetical protein
MGGTGLPEPWIRVATMMLNNDKRRLNSINGLTG